MLAGLEKACKDLEVILVLQQSLQGCNVLLQLSVITNQGQEVFSALNQPLDAGALPEGPPGHFS